MGRPARTAPFAFVQPSGETVMLQRVGDEHFHFTADVRTGMPVIAREGTYYYASLASDGRSLCASSVAVSDAADAPVFDAGYVRNIRSALGAMHRESVRTKAAASASASFGRFTSLDGVPSNFVREGDVPCLVILVQFSDVKFTCGKNAIERWLNDESTGSAYPSGSVRSYFVKQSGGRFRPQFEVYGTYTAPYGATYYADAAGSLAVEALRSLQSGIDLSRYDVNSDGAVDNVYMLYAGDGGHLTDGYIWPANEAVGATVQGLTVNRVAYANEMDSYLGKQQGIGTFTHEFGHVLGLSDLYTLGGNYPESSTDYWTPTYWDVMDQGCDLNDGTCPPNMSAFERHALGWTTPYEPAGPGYFYLASQEADGRGVMVRNPSDANEVVYFEYRDRQGWDSYHCGSGLLVWHVRYDESAWNNLAVNNDAASSRVKIICADGQSGNGKSLSYNGWDLVTKLRTDSYLAGDPFPGTTGKTSLTPTSSPALLTASGSAFTLGSGARAALTGIGLKTLEGQNYMAFSMAGATDNSADRHVIGSEGQSSSIAGIGADKTPMTVTSSGLSVTVSRAAGPAVEAFDLAGRPAARASVDSDGSASFTLPSAGIYLIRSGSHTARVLIR